MTPVIPNLPKASFGFDLVLFRRDVVHGRPVSYVRSQPVHLGCESIGDGAGYLGCPLPTNQKNPGCVGYIEDDTAQLCGNFNKPL